VEHYPEQGKYDLIISKATYDRDNGQFECRMKEGGTGDVLHSKSVELTVLLQPSNPKISPSDATATEGRPLNLTCASIGGSPPPQIYWYKEGQSKKLEANLIPGRNKDEPTRSILTIIPTKEQDNTRYLCTVWNRALGNRQKLEASTAIFVNCKYFQKLLSCENTLKLIYIFIMVITVNN
jgi:echinoid protein